MNKWHRAATREIESLGLKVVAKRSGGHHDVWQLSNGVTITLSLSPRSIEQAVRNFRFELKRRLSGSGRRRFLPEQHHGR